jgi:hypothetical protein
LRTVVVGVVRKEVGIGTKGQSLSDSLSRVSSQDEIEWQQDRQEHSQRSFDHILPELDPLPLRIKRVSGEEEGGGRSVITWPIIELILLVDVSEIFMITQFSEILPNTLLQALLALGIISGSCATEGTGCWVGLL